MSEQDWYEAREAAERSEMAMDALQDELTRLRAIEAAAREVLGSTECQQVVNVGNPMWFREDHPDLCAKLDALRAALEGKSDPPTDSKGG